MKKYYLKYFMSFILLIPITCAQENQQTIFNIHSLGDTLDKQEREFYKLFPNVDDFEWAIFYRGEKNTITAKVCYLVLGKVKYRDYENYLGSLGNINRYLDEVNNV